MINLIIKNGCIYRIGVFFMFTLQIDSLKANDTLFLKNTIQNTSEIKLDNRLDFNYNYRLKKPILNNKKPKNTWHWMKFSICNHTKHTNFVIEFSDPHTSKIKVFEDLGNQKYIKIQNSGFSEAFGLRALDHKNHVNTLSLNQNQTKHFCVHYFYDVDTNLKAEVKTIEEFVSYSLKEYIILGVFYGILFLLLAYNFILYFTNKKSYYLWYVAYIICCCIQTFNENGIGYQYLWPNYPALNYIFYNYGSLLLAICFLCYTKSFLGKNHFSLHKLFFLILGITITDFMFKKSFLNAYWTIPYLILFTYSMYVSTLGFRKKIRLFSYFNIGNLVLLTSFLVFTGRVFGLIPNFWLTVYFFNIGFVIEGIVFSYAMAYRLNKTHEKLEVSQLKIIEELKEKELLKDRVNRELEQKVSERTNIVENQKKELLILNSELKEFQKKINYMNSELDKDNFRLKKNLVEAKKQNVFKRIVSFEEFTNVFKSENDCYRHLIELKWGEEYKCKKCKNKKFSLIDKTHNRKCTQCKHIESPTANTIFHGIKFPLSKAFYLVYTTHYNKKELTIDELSTELTLRRNTLWSFRKKVNERKEQLLINNKIEVNSSWEKLIVD